MNSEDLDESESLLDESLSDEDILEAETSDDDPDSLSIDWKAQMFFSFNVAFLIVQDKPSEDPGNKTAFTTFLLLI